MPLATGTRLGPYEILGPLGAGGMGEVYKGRDTRLDRTVALKVLPEHIASDPELRQRLEREARAISSLDHPHICALYDVGRQNGIDFLVMQYLEGETLADTLGRGALPVDLTLKYGIEIADALDRAHRQGIVHRDLKPSNIMVTKSGVKLLDFGLAKLTTGTAIGEGLTQDVLTREGAILGTLLYMSPEQLQGKDADARADIFAFGVIVYEMLTGRTAFEGTSQASLIGAILHMDPPPISTLQPKTPPLLEWVVQGCLAKDPGERWQTAHDVKLQLKRLSDAGGEFDSVAGAPHVSKTRERVAWAAAAIAVLALLVLSGLSFSRAPTAGLPVRFLVGPPENGAFVGPIATVPVVQLAISPDGRRLVFVASTAGSAARLWIRDLDTVVARPLPGTDDAAYPFWSPDSQAIGFFAQGKLKKVGSPGGTAQVLCDAPEPRGGTWNAEGVIVFSFSNSAGLNRVSAAGGTPTPVTALDPSRQEVSHRWPVFLPDNRHIVYRMRSAERQHEGIYVTSLESRETRRLLDSPWSVAYAAPGYLLFLADGTLMAQRFEEKNLRLEGEPSPVAERVGGSTTDYASFSVSETGVLAHGGATTIPTQLTWFDRTGRKSDAITPAGDYVSFALSRDQRRVAFARVDPQYLTDIWLLDLARGTSSRFTATPGLDTHAVWSVGDSSIVFRSQRAGVLDLFEKASSGARAEEKLQTPGWDKVPTDWSADGRFIVYHQQATTAASRYDLWVFPTRERKAVPFLQTEFTEMHGRLSPNGRFIAHTSDESGRFEVYVRTFPDPAGKWQISANGGAEPTWRRDGKELFYLAADRKLVSVSVKTDGSFDADVPRALFETHVSALNTPYRSNYVPTADGQRFLVNTAVEGSSALPITVVLDWMAALKR